MSNSFPNILSISLLINDYFIFLKIFSFLNIGLLTVLEISHTISDKHYYATSCPTRENIQINGKNRKTKKIGKKSFHFHIGCLIVFECLLLLSMSTKLYVLLIGRNNYSAIRK